MKLILGMICSKLISFSVVLGLLFYSQAVHAEPTVAPTTPPPVGEQAAQEFKFAWPVPSRV